MRQLRHRQRLRGQHLRELFRHADKNMYVDKNRANREEAEARKLQNQQLLQWVNAHGYQFSNCLYCDALLDQYRVLRTSAGFFLADNGSYSVQWSRSWTSTPPPPPARRCGKRCS